MSRTIRLLPLLTLALTTVACDEGTPDDETPRADDAPECGIESLPCPDTAPTSAATDDVPSSSDDGGSDDGSSSDDSGSSDDCSTDDDGADEDEAADLPYNYDVALGDVVLLADIFAEEGPQPAAVTSLEPREGDWRLVELVGGVAFEVTQDDCDHEGSEGTGRDRFDITWQNADGSIESDHFTIRYCED
jgi:hypothetical protein